jgi:uncharacterized protein YbjT (DUF2867 family)
LRILISGATGTVGQATLAALTRRPGHETIAAVLDPTETVPNAHQSVRLDFTDPATFAPALAGVDRLLFLRPPQLADVKRIFAPFIAALAEARVGLTAFLSLQGAERNAVTPHAKIEKRLTEAGIPACFLRPSFFMQNLTAAHRAEIRDRDEIYIPAGSGRTAFIDALDIGEAAAIVLTEDGHAGTAPELTGSEALTYAEVADILSEVLGRPIRYARPLLTQFVARRVAEGDELDYAAVIGAIYSVARVGRAGELTDTLERLIGRKPTSFRTFAEREKAAWMR